MTEIFESLRDESAVIASEARQSRARKVWIATDAGALAMTEKKVDINDRMSIFGVYCGYIRRNL